MDCSELIRGTYTLGKQSPRSNYSLICLRYSRCLSVIGEVLVNNLEKTHTHTHSHTKRKTEELAGRRGRKSEILMRRREHICLRQIAGGRNLVGVNERQLVLIKNESAL